MFENIKRHAKLIREAPAGERFKAYYYEEKETRPVKVLIKLAVGFVCMCIGVVLAFTPGPAFVFWIIGFALMASQLYIVASFLDATEVFMRRKFKKNSTS